MPCWSARADEDLAGVRNRGPRLGVQVVAVVPHAPPARGSRHRGEGPRTGCRRPPPGPPRDGQEVAVAPRRPARPRSGRHGGPPPAPASGRRRRGSTSRRSGTQTSAPPPGGVRRGDGLGDHGRPVVGGRRGPDRARRLPRPQAPEEGVGVLHVRPPHHRAARGEGRRRGRTPPSRRPRGAAARPGGARRSGHRRSARARVSLSRDHLRGAAPARRSPPAAAAAGDPCGRSRPLARPRSRPRPGRRNAPSPALPGTAVSAIARGTA